jgi:hypothetical protein
MGHRYRLVWENLRLTVEPKEEHWQAFVYDETTYAVLYRAERMSVHGAKVSGVEFALWRVLSASLYVAAFEPSPLRFLLRQFSAPHPEVSEVPYHRGQSPPRNTRWAPGP